MAFSRADGKGQQPLLVLKDVSKSFGAVAALRGVHQELYSGVAHALVGENGAGKSTLIKTIAGAHARTPARSRWTDSRCGSPGLLMRAGRRNRGDLPGADALPRPFGRGEHLHGSPAVAEPRPHRP